MLVHRTKKQTKQYTFKRQGQWTVEEVADELEDMEKGERLQQSEYFKGRINNDSTNLVSRTEQLEMTSNWKL